VDVVRPLQGDGGISPELSIGLNIIHGRVTWTVTLPEERRHFRKGFYFEKLDIDNIDIPSNYSTYFIV